MGRGPKDMQTHLIGNLLVVRLHGVLMAAEQQLVKTLLPEKGWDLLKEVRTQLIELARPIMGVKIQAATGVNVVRLHRDISTATGEEVMLFIFAESPLFRETQKNSPDFSWSLSSPTCKQRESTATPFACTSGFYFAV